MLQRRMLSYGLLLLVMSVGAVVGCRSQQAPPEADLQAQIDAQATQIARLSAALTPTPTVTGSPIPAKPGPPTPFPTVTPEPTPPSTPGPAPDEFYVQFLSEKRVRPISRLDAFLTGDRAKQTVLVGMNEDCGSCNFKWVFVFDGRHLLFSSNVLDPEILPRTGAQGFAITYPDPLLDQPLCCPTRFVKQAYSWTGKEFVADGPPTAVAPLQLPEPGVGLHTPFADVGLRMRMLFGDPTPTAVEGDFRRWQELVERWTPEQWESWEQQFPDMEERQRAYVQALVAMSRGLSLNSAYLRRLWSNGVVRNTPQVVAGYYAYSLDNSYRGKAVPTATEYWNLFLDNEKKAPKAVTCSWPLRAIAHEWKRSTPAYQFAIESKNARSVWLFAVAGCGGAEHGFDDHWPAYLRSRLNNPNLTWAEYLWQRFGK